MVRPLNPLDRLKQQARGVKKRQEKEVVRCSEAGTEVLKDSIEEVIETAKTHDDQQHGGEPTAEVNGIIPPQFSEKEKHRFRRRFNHYAREASRREKR
jgi:hypothetical protein